MKSATALLIVLFLVLQYHLWFDETGIIATRRLQNNLEEQLKQNDILKQKNLQVVAEVADLKQGHEAIEEHAREELSMVKRNEKFYQYVDK
jgi:cell division protein FtsB